MSDTDCQHKISSTKCLSQICMYILERAKNWNLCEYEAYIDVLRRLFVPTINDRLIILLEHFVYGPEKSECFASIPNICLLVSAPLKRFLSTCAIASAFVSSLLLSRRLDKIGSELECVNFPLAEIKLVDFHCNWEFWSVVDSLIRYYHSTFLNCPESPAITQQRNTEAGSSSCKGEDRLSLTSSPPYPSDLATLSTEDQSQSSCSFSDYSLYATDSSSLEATKDRRRQGGNRHRRKNSRIRLIVRKIYPFSSGRNRASPPNDYLKLPCNSNTTLGGKVLERNRAKCSITSKKPEKLNEHIKNVCDCINSAIEEIDDSTLSQSSLSCNISKEHIRLKLENAKSKLCAFTSKITVKEDDQKIMLDKKQSSLKNNVKDNLESADKRFCDKTNCKKLSDKMSSTKNGSKRTNRNTQDKCQKVDNCNDVDADEICTGLWNEITRKNNYTPCQCAEDNTNEPDVEAKCERDLEKNIEQLHSEIEEMCRNIILPREYKGIINDDCKKMIVHKSVGVKTDDKPKTDCSNRPESNKRKNVAACTEDIDDSVELTNIYINEIALCDCKGSEVKNSSLVDDHSNTVKNNDICKKSSKNVATHTKHVRYKENSTQIIDDDMQYITCTKYGQSERELDTVNYEKKVTCVPEKLCFSDDTSLNRMMQEICRSPCNSNELANAIIMKINEIVNLNEKIRAQVATKHDNNNSNNKLDCQTSNQEINCHSSEKINIKLEVSTSVVSILSKPSKTKQVSPQTSCNSQTCKYKKNQRSKKKQINRHTSTCKIKKQSTNNHRRHYPPYERVSTCRTSSILSKTISNDRSIIDIRLSRSTCCDNRFSRGDEEIPIRDSSTCSKCHYVQRPCKCSRKSNFLRFLSDHLTREAFERCKRILCCVLRGILEQAKALAELRRRNRTADCPRRCYCSDNNHNNCSRQVQESNEQVDPCDSWKTWRIAAGSDLIKQPTRNDAQAGWDRENREANLRRNRMRHARKRRSRHGDRIEWSRVMRARSSPDQSELDKRQKRINAFASRWR